MVKRAVLFAAVATVALAPVPALAGERESGLSEMSARLADPELQGAIAGMLGALSNAMLAMKVAPIAKAAEAMGDRKLARRIGPDTSLRDLAGRDSTRMQRELDEKLPRAMTAMAGMTGAMEAMLPQLEAMARQMGEQMGGVGDTAQTPAES